jgi:guanylate kinase
MAASTTSSTGTHSSAWRPRANSWKARRCTATSTTSQRQIERIRAGGHDALLEIDWQGAQQVRRLFPDAIGIFILPPSLEALRHRLVARGQDSHAVIQRRLAAAEDEMSHAVEFNYAIINNEFDEARRDLAAVIRAARLSLARQSARYPELFRPHNAA